MRRLSKVFTFMFVCFFSISLLVGCANKNIVSGYIKDDTIETTVLLNSTLDTSRAIAVFKFENGETKEVASKDLSFGTIDTSSTGIKKLKVTYVTYSFNVDIVVVGTEAELNAKIMSLSSKLLTDYTENKKVQTNQQTQFKDRSQPLYVGDDNYFDFRIEAIGLDEEGNLHTDIQQVTTNIVVELKEDTSYTLLEGEDLEEYVEIDTLNTKFDFNEDAIGKEFRVTVSAVNRDADYAESATRFTANLIVVDAFNVYTAKELSVYDNVNNDKWDTIKTQMNLKNVTVNGIVLQNNINVTRNSVAAAYFWTQRTDNYNTAKNQTNLTLEGTLIDTSGDGIFKRTIQNGETFNFIGNYFTISVSDELQCVIQGTNGTDGGIIVEEENADSYITSHMSLFYTSAADGEITTTTQVNWKNIYFVGNAPMNQDAKDSGGIILMKNNRVNFTAYNTITHNFYIGYFLELGVTNKEGTYVIDSCKGFNSYNTLFYFWGAKNVLIHNSEFKGAGGPAMIVDHYRPETDGSGGIPSTVNVVASTIESIVTGQEPWFDIYGATMVVGQLSVDGEAAFYNPSIDLVTPKTIIAGTVGQNVPQINMVAVYKSSEAAGLTTNRIRGAFYTFNTTEDYNTHYGLNGATQTVKNYGLDMNDLGADNLASKAMSNRVTYLQSSGNGGYVNSGFGVTNTDASFNPQTGQGYNWWTGDYCNVFTPNGMAAVVKLYNRAA